jgi:KDO2-lipid IV(A) lauroyltransferase
MGFLGRLNRRLLLRYRLEYLVALSLVFTVRAMSPGFAWAGARLLGALLYRLGLRRKPILANLALVFPEMTEAERDRVGCRCMQHFLSVLVDVLFERRMLSRRNILHRVRTTGWARRYLDRYGVAGFRERARRVLFLTAHYGNWELAPTFFDLLGIPIVPTFRAIRNPFMNRLVRRLRLVSQPRMIERRGAVPLMLEEFERGGNVGMLFDQEAAHGLQVPFFGIPSRTHKTPAVLARDHGVKIFFGVMVRLGDFFRYEARGELLEELPPRTEDRARDLVAITRELNRRLEEEIRERPEQYFWMHRRWKRSGLPEESP